MTKRLIEQAESAGDQVSDIPSEIDPRKVRLFRGRGLDERLGFDGLVSSCLHEGEFAA
ncbi:hypothetical protein [Rhizobacter sp. P5_C2]